MIKYALSIDDWKLAPVVSPRNTFSFVMVKQTRQYNYIKGNFMDYIHPTYKM